MVGRFKEYPPGLAVYMCPDGDLLDLAYTCRDKLTIDFLERYDGTITFYNGNGKVVAIHPDGRTLVNLDNFDRHEAITAVKRIRNKRS